jgi:aryl-alcohol dehydrogenase-like predicted oxidoreductase
MKYTTIPGTALNVSALCLGAGQFGANLPESDACRQMDIFSEEGGTFLDTARIYTDWIPGEKGRSERITGEYLVERKSRERWVIATKGGHPLLSAMEKSRIRREELTRDIDESLKTLQTDYIDLYYLHRDDARLGVEEIIDLMNEFVAAGKLRYFGCSNWETERIREAQRYAKTTSQMGFCANQSLWNLGCYSMAAPADPTLVVMDKEMIQFHRETELAAVPYSSQAGGFFSKRNESPKQAAETALKNGYASSENVAVFSAVKTVAEAHEAPISHVVLGYLLSQQIAVIPVFSCRTIEQLHDTILGVEIELSAGDLALLDSLNGSGLG